jgi:hypothetical protein
MVVALKLVPDAQERTVCEVTTDGVDRNTPALENAARST